jgi:hypothetical protein
MASGTSRHAILGQPPGAQVAGEGKTRALPLTRQGATPPWNQLFKVGGLRGPTSMSQPVCWPP